MPKNRKSTKQWAKFPMTLDDNYRSRLKPVTSRIIKLYQELIEPELSAWTKHEYINLKKISFDDSVEESIGKKFHEFRVKYYGVSYPLNGDPRTLSWQNKVEKQVQIESKSVSRVHKRRYDKNVNFVLGVDPLKNEPWLSGVLRDWTDWNVRLIKDIPDFAINSMQNIIMESVMRGDSTSFLKGELSKIMSKSDSDLKRIARDQTNKLYASLTKFRSQSNGWDFYQWSDSNDSRVREDHVVLDDLSSKKGYYFRFSDPPIMVTKGKRAGQRGNAGDDIQDRCVSIVSFLPEWRFKKNNDFRGSYRLIPISDLPPQQQRMIA